MQTFAEVQAASSAAYRTLGDLEWEVESTGTTEFLFIKLINKNSVTGTRNAIPAEPARIGTTLS